MTFSDRRIIDLVTTNFEAVWESAAPVKTATFDLGDGHSVKGTVGGEIAIYFCRPDGAVFDILPALQSPAVTREAIQSALLFYQATGATLEATKARHEQQLAQFDSPAKTVDWANMPHKSHLSYRTQNATPGGRVLAEMAFSKTGITTFDESVIVIEPGGRDLYGNPLRYAFTRAVSLVKPGEWKEYVFEDVLGQELAGGDFHFNSMSVAPFSMGN